MNEVSEIGESTHQRKRKPITRRLGDTNLVLHIVGQVRKRVALLQPAVFSDLFVTSRERNRLERKESNLLGIVQSESNNRADLIVVDSIYQRGNKHDFDSCFTQVVDSAHLHVEKIADLTMAIGVVADAIELQVHVTETGFGRLATEFFALGELNSVGRGLHAVVANFSRVSD